MSDVSCKLVQSHLDFYEQQGFRASEILERASRRMGGDATLTPEFIADPINKIHWNAFSVLTEEFEALGLDDSIHEKFFDIAVSTPSFFMPYMRLAAGLIASPLQLYKVNNTLLGPGLFDKAVLATLRVSEDGKIHVSLLLRPDCRETPFFFKYSRVGMQKLPKLIGLAEARVEATYSGRAGDYVITPPPSGTLWARTARLFRVQIPTQMAIETLTEADEELRENYKRIVESERLLKEARSELEKRVQERTRELEEANTRLEERLVEITQKEDENRRLYEQIAHLQKLEAVGTLAGGISHEINNVLHGIYLSLDLADRLTPADHSAKERLATAKKFATRGQHLMKQVLAFSRKPQIERRPIELVSAVKEAAELMRSTIPKNIAIRESYSIELSHQPSVMGDPTQLQQVIVNLCSNAAHAMRETGGEIAIAVDHDPKANAASIRVADTGAGISPEIRSRIFEPFFTTKPVGQGTGLGLSVVHGIVQSFGGRIEFRNLPDGGVEFTIELPTIEGPSADEPDADELGQMGGSERVLLVDDEPELLELCRDTLSAFGYDIVGVPGGQEALALIEGDGKPFDLVITDHIMPHMTGMELTKRVRSRFPSMPVLLCTGFSEPSGPSPFQEDRITKVVSKPIDPFALNTAMRSLLDQRK